MKPIKLAYEKNGHLHADNEHHPGITESDLIEVLTGVAYIEVDAQKPWKKYATGVTSGKYDILTVVYLELPTQLLAITAYPARGRGRREYLRQIGTGKGGKIWIPAEPAEPTS